jgi:hypothetical protein
MDSVNRGPSPVSSVEEFIKFEFNMLEQMYPDATWIETRCTRNLDGSHSSYVLVNGKDGNIVWQYP